jgi:hypothetical protein
MLTRREILQSCAALAVSPMALDVPGRLHHQGVPLSAFVIDPGSDDALAVADLVAAHGVRMRSCGRDLLCQDWLAHAWTGQDGVLSGVTGAAPLFYLERLAWSQGLRVVFLGRHPTGVDGREHAVAGPQAVVDVFHTQTRLTDWRRALAGALLRMPSGTPALRPLSAVRDAVVSGDRALFSWVLDRPSVSSSRDA